MSEQDTSFRAFLVLLIRLGKKAIKKAVKGNFTPEQHSIIELLFFGFLSFLMVFIIPKPFSPLALLILIPGVLRFIYWIWVNEKRDC